MKINKLFPVILLLTGLVYWGPTDSTGNMIGGECDNPNATSVAEVNCRQAVGCQGYKYEKCYQTPGLTLDYQCVNNAIGTPCQDGPINCGNSMDADYDFCDEVVVQP